MKHFPGKALNNFLEVCQRRKGTWLWKHWKQYLTKLQWAD